MFITLNGKKLLFLIVAIIAAIVMVVAICFASVSDVMAPKTDRKLPIYRVDRGDEKVVAISFDAAWGADKTRGIIDILNRYKVRATFFLVGFWIDKFEAEVKAIADSGLEIGNHSRNHLKMSTLSEADIDAEIDYVNSEVKRITGKECKVFRPPFGDYNDRLISRVEAKGMKGIQWDVDSLDWKGIQASEIINRITSKVKNGSIILCHNNSEHILEALPTVIERLQADGYKFVTMSEMIYADNYTIDNNGEQHKNTAA